MVQGDFAKDPTYVKHEFFVTLELLEYAAQLRNDLILADLFVTFIIID